MTQSSDTSLFVYVGSYTRTLPHVKGKGEGIYIFRMDRASGALAPAGDVLGLSNPSYLAFDPTQRYLYTVDEIDQGNVSAFAVDPATGALTRLEQHVSSEGDVPCHLSVDPSGRWVLTANYTSGHVVSLPIRPDGSLGDAVEIVHHHGHSVHPDRQESAHAHWISVDPTGRYVLVADLGLDKVLVYHFDPEYGTLTPNDPPACDLPPGSGPRHLVFHPSGRFAYVINELASTLTTCAYDGERGILHPLQTLSTLPADFTGHSTTSAIRIHPSGKFVYGSNRGHDSLAMFAVNDDGTLTPVGHTPTQGRNPRDFNIDPTGAFLIAGNQDTDTLVTFRIDTATGQLTPTGAVTPVMTPVCIVFYPR
ncbi:MAG: lactonase family protein [Anaerolineae bacterium]|nr:lactonase family protein [Anaerolineae bacterium]